MKKLVIRFLFITVLSSVGLQASPFANILSQGANVVFIADSSESTIYYIEFESLEWRVNQERKAAEAEFRRPKPVNHHLLYISKPKYSGYSIVVRKNNAVIARGTAGDILRIDGKHGFPFDIYATSSGTRYLQFRVEDKNYKSHDIENEIDSTSKNTSNGEASNNSNRVDSVNIIKQKDIGDELNNLKQILNSGF